MGRLGTIDIGFSNCNLWRNKKVGCDRFVGQETFVIGDCRNTRCENWLGDHMQQEHDFISVGYLFGWAHILLIFLILADCCWQWYFAYKSDA